MPRKFKDLLGTHKTSHDIEPSVRSFFSMFSIDSHRCANELYSFATYFGKLIDLDTKEQEMTMTQEMVRKGRTMN